MLKTDKVCCYLKRFLMFKIYFCWLPLPKYERFLMSKYFTVKSVVPIGRKCKIICLVQKSSSFSVSSSEGSRTKTGKKDI